MSEPLSILSLRGALDDTSPVSAMAADACTLAENIEFVRSTCGERRKGCTAADIDTFFAGYDAVVWQFRHVPNNNEGQAQLWALAQNLSAPYAYKLGYRDESGWTEVTLDDPLDATPPNGHRMSAATLHDKLFLAYKSDVNRLHVWDGTTLRRAGLAEPDAPTAADTGSGTYASERFFRIRITVQDVGGTTILRSEPSESYAFTPSGSGSGASIAQPTLPGEGETHWEIEASLEENGDYYVIATLVIATTSYTDSTAAGTGYAEGNELSEDIGDYSLWPSVRLLSADEDRLLGAGNYEDPDEDSRVNWSPVFNEPGVGNDERLQLDTDPFRDLDGYEGGGLTTLSRATNGYLYAGKNSHIYRIVRQGQRTKAYDAIPLTKSVGSLAGSLVEAIDQSGNPSLYQLDLKQGPYRQGAAGLQWCGRDLFGKNADGLWRRFNRDAIVPCHGQYDSENRQVHYWIALDGSDYPNAKIIVHVNEMRDTEEGARRGWVTVPVDDLIAAAHCSVMFADNMESTDARTSTLVPYIGVADGEIWRCGTGTDDNGTEYRAKGRTRPFMPGKLLQHVEVENLTLLCEAIATADAEISVKAIVNFGADSLTKETDMEAVGAETDVIKPLDSLSIAEAWVIQFEFGDLAGSFIPSNWAVNALIAKIKSGQVA